MAKVKDILSANELEILRRTKTDDEIIAIARQRNKEHQELLKNKQTKPQNKYDNDGFLNSVVRAGAEATSRGVAALDWVDNKVGFDLISDEFASKNTKILNQVEKVKEETSAKGNWKPISAERKAEKKALEVENANAKGFLENAGVGLKTLYDTVANPNEWTTQGMIAGILPNDPGNALSLVAGPIAGKIIQKLGGGMASNVAFGVADGVVSGGATEYAVAKGTGKTDDEANKAFAQGATAGAIIPAVTSTVGATLTNKNTHSSDTDANKNIPKVQEAVFNNPMMNVDNEIKNIITEKNTETVNTLNEAEQKATQMHEEIKIKLNEADAQGATLDEMIAIQENIPISEAEHHYSKVLNGDNTVSNDVAGFKIINKIEDTIKNSTLTQDEVFIKLREKGISQDLAKVASQSYKEKNTDILSDFISNKVSEHLELEDTNFKNNIAQKVDIYNKQIIADEKAWSVSPTKQTIDNFVSENIGDDFVAPGQRDMIYELNKIGLVNDITVDNIDKKFDLSKGADGAYNTNDKTITIDEKVPNTQKAQILTHEYIHGATTKLLQNKTFFDDVNTLMNSAKGKSKNKKHYGYKTPDEFIAEAFSDPAFAKELNDMSLTAEMRKRFGVDESFKSVWDVVVSKFSEVVTAMTGKKFDINRGSYFESLNDVVSKQIQELENIRNERISTGESLKNDYLSNPTIFKATEFDNLKLHPRFDELVEMRKDIKASDIKYDKKVINKGTVVHDNDKFNGIDNTFVVPTSYEKNYNADFKLTKQDIDNIKNGKITDDITQKIADDLYVLDNHPDWKAYSDDVDVVQSKEILGDEFSQNNYINNDGVLVNNGKVLFSKKGDNTNGKIKNKKRDRENVVDRGAKSNSAANGKPTNNKNDGGDTSSSRTDAKLSNNNKRVEGQSTSSNTSGDISKFDTDKVVQLKSKESFKGIKDRNLKEILFHVKDESPSLVKKYDDFSNQTIDTLDNFFHGLDKDGNIKQKTNRVVDIVRNNLITNSFKSKEFVELLQQTKREKSRLKVYAKNMQENLNKLTKEESSSLVLALDGDIPKADIKKTLGDDLYTIYQQLRVQIDTNMNALIDAGLLDKDVAKEDYVKRFYKEHLESKSIFSGIMGSDHKINEKHFKRKNLTKEQRDNINQIRDAGYVVARTLLEQNRQLKKAKFLSTLADQFSSDTIKDGFVQVPNNVKNGLNVWGKLNGKFVPEHIMDELNGIYKMEQNLDNWAQRNTKTFTRWIKGTWTAGNAGTHLYNIISNNLNLYLNGLIFTTKNGRKFGGSRGLDGMKRFLSKDTKEAYKKELVDTGLYDDNFFDALDDVAQDMKERSNTDKWKMKDFYNGMLFRQDSKFTQKVQDIYDVEDKIYRVFAYEETKYDIKVEKYEAANGKVKRFTKDIISDIENIELSKDDMTKAMNEARDMFVDYSKEVPPIVSTLDNYMLAPFLRYTYLATIRQSKTAIKHPFRAMAVGLFMEEAIQGIFGDGEDLNSDDVLKPEWMETGASNWNMYGANNFIKVGDTKEESTWLNMGRALPGFRMFAITAGLYGDIYKILVDNQDKYGRDLFNPHDENYLKALKTVSKLSETIMPPMSPIALPVYHGDRFTAYGNIKKDKDGKPMTETLSIGGRYSQKLINGAMGSKLDRYGNPLELTDVVKQMFGLKLEKINKKDEANKKLESLNREYKPKINKQKEKNLNNPTKKKQIEKEYHDKIDKIKKAAGGFDLNSEDKKSNGFGFSDGYFDIKLD